MNVLKFLGLLAAMAIVRMYVPYGDLINGGVIAVALWKLVND